MRFGGRPVLLGGAAGAACPKLASDRSSASTVRVCRGGIVCSLNFLLLETLKGQFYHVTRHGPLEHQMRALPFRTTKPVKCSIESTTYRVMINGH